MQPRGGARSSSSSSSLCPPRPRAKPARGGAAVLGHLPLVLGEGLVVFVVVVGCGQDDVLEVDVRRVLGGLVAASRGVGGCGRGAADFLFFLGGGFEVEFFLPVRSLLPLRPT